MKFKDKPRGSGVDINLTPLIDVVFLLLIFFMVSTTFVYTNSLKVNLPKAKGEAVENRKNVNITVSVAGDILINGKKALKNDFPGLILKEFEKNPSATVIIEADKMSKHGDVVFVMDESKKAGFEKLAIAAEE